MKPTPSQEDKDKVQQGNARRGEERANGPRGSTRATPETKDAASDEAKKRLEADRKATRGERPGNQEWDCGGGDISRGG